MEQTEIDAIVWEGEPQVSEAKFAQLFGFFLITRNEFANNECRAAMNKSIRKEFGVRDNADDVACNCTPDENGRRCKDESCERRAMFIECPPACGEGCCNRPFGNGTLKTKFKLVPRIGRGFGIVANEYIRPGHYIVEFHGVIHVETENPLYGNTMYACRIKMHSSMKPNERLVIEPTHRGNIARYCGHSCNPNCKMVTMYAGDELRNVLVATKPINPGMEIMWDYGEFVADLGVENCLCLEEHHCRNMENALNFLAQKFAMIINELFNAGGNTPQRTSTEKGLQKMIRQICDGYVRYISAVQSPRQNEEPTSSRRALMAAGIRSPCPPYPCSPTSRSTPPPPLGSPMNRRTPHRRSPRCDSDSPPVLSPQGAAALSPNVPMLQDLDDSDHSPHMFGLDVRGREADRRSTSPRRRDSEDDDEDLRRCNRKMGNKSKSSKRKAMVISSESSSGDGCTPTAKFQKGGSKQKSKKISTLKGKSSKSTQVPPIPKKPAPVRRITRAGDKQSDPCPAALPPILEERNILQAPRRRAGRRQSVPCPSPFDLEAAPPPERNEFLDARTRTTRMQTPPCPPPIVSPLAPRRRFPRPPIIDAKKTAPTCGAQLLAGLRHIAPDEEEAPRSRGRPRTSLPTPPGPSELPRNPRGRPRSNPEGFARQCELCGEFFQHAGNYNTHMKYKHSDEKNFKCDRCPATFKTDQDLVRHKKTHLPKEQQTRYGCPSCTKTYSRADDVRVHQRNTNCPAAEAIVIPPKRTPKAKDPKTKKGKKPSKPDTPSDESSDD